jgi:hypothetical protein
MDWSQIVTSSVTETVKAVISIPKKVVICMTLGRPAARHVPRGQKAPRRNDLPESVRQSLQIGKDRSALMSHRFNPKDLRHNDD